MQKALPKFDHETHNPLALTLYQLKTSQHPCLQGLCRQKGYQPTLLLLGPAKDSLVPRSQSLMLSTEQVLIANNYLT